jgi:hemolysin III
MILKKKVESLGQSFGEEMANAITHGAGAILSLLGLIILIYYSVLTKATCHIVSCSLYGTTLLLLFLISTLYHSITHPTAKIIFRKLDHISIFLLIAGTNMPLALVALKGYLGWLLFSFQCFFCIVGIIFKICYGYRYPIVSLILYLLMGWVTIFAVKPIMLALSLHGFMWVLYGGIFYTLGVIFFITDHKFQYFHAIWHLFVLFGSACHFVVVLFYVIPLPAL